MGISVILFDHFVTINEIVLLVVDVLLGATLYLILSLLFRSEQLKFILSKVNYLQDT